MGKQTKPEEVVTKEPRPDEFPKMLYFKGDVAQQKIVNSQADEDALGEDWIDAPADTAA